MRVKVNDSPSGQRHSESCRLNQPVRADNAWRRAEEVRSRESCTDKMVSVPGQDDMELSVANQIVNLLSACEVIVYIKMFLHGDPGANKSPTPPSWAAPLFTPHERRPLVPSEKWTPGLVRLHSWSGPGVILYDTSQHFIGRKMIWGQLF